MMQTFGVRLRVTAIKAPVWYSNGFLMVFRKALDPDHPESIHNWIRKNLGIEPEPWMVKPSLNELLENSRNIVNNMSPEEKADMIRKQGEGWARSEAQWAKDFREGKCRRD